MNNSQEQKKTILISSIELDHLKFEHQSDDHIVSLVDAQGYKIISGYGKSIIEAINDLHHNLI